jgi:transposase
MPALSQDIRERIVATYEAGNTSIRQLAERFQVSKNAVHQILKLKRETGSLLPKPASGGKPSQLLGKEAEARAMVQAHPDYTLAEYCELWRETTGLDIHESTMCRFLQKLRLTRKKNKQEQQGKNRRSTTKESRLLVDSGDRETRKFNISGRDGHITGYHAGYGKK